MYIARFRHFHSAGNAGNLRLVRRGFRALRATHQLLPTPIRPISVVAKTVRTSGLYWGRLRERERGREFSDVDVEEEGEGGESDGEKEREDGKEAEDVLENGHLEEGLVQQDGHDEVSRIEATLQYILKYRKTSNKHPGSLSFQPLNN